MEGKLEDHAVAKSFIGKRMCIILAVFSAT